MINIMMTTKILQLTVVALLLQVMISLTGVYVNAAPDSFDCKKPYGAAHENSEVDIICSMLYQKLEGALVAPSNIYKLRHTFFPSTRADPLVVTVVYDLQFTSFPALNETDIDVCTIAMLQSDGSEDKGLNTAINSTTTEYIWTSSVPLSFVDPEIFNYFQPPFLLAVSPLTEDQDSVAIPLQISYDELPCIPTESQLFNVLDDLTTNIKSYATRGGKLETWDTPYLGHTVEQGGERYAYLFFVAPPIALLILIYVFSTMFMLSKWFRKEVIEKYLLEAGGLARDEKNVKHRLAMISAVLFLIILTNIAYYAIDFICFIYLASKSGAPVITDTSFWLRNTFHYGSVGLALIVASIITFYTGRRRRQSGTNNLADSSSDDQQQITDSTCVTVTLNIVDSNIRLHGAVVYISYISCPFVLLPCCHSDKIKFLYFYMVWSILIFVNIIAWNFIPVLTLLFVRLILTFAIFSLILTLFALVAIFTTYLMYSFAKSHDKIGSSKKFSKKIDEIKDPKWQLILKVFFWDKFWFGLSSGALLIFTVTIILVVYFLIIRKGAADGGISGFVIALVPTIITAIVTWLGKKGLDNVLKKELKNVLESPEK